MTNFDHITSHSHYADNNLFSKHSSNKDYQMGGSTGHPYSKKVPLEYCWQIITELDSR